MRDDRMTTASPRRREFRIILAFWGSDRAAAAKEKSR